MVRQVIAIDFDHTLWDTAKQTFLPGARDAVEVLRGRGYRVLVHSCNQPKWIRKQLDEAGIVVDGVWGEQGLEAAKPVCALYVDDLGYHFKGDWGEALPEILARLGR